MKMSEIAEEIQRSLPDRLQETLLRAVFVAYQSASEDIEDVFEKPERRTLLGYAQRAKLETQFRALPRGRKGAHAELVQGPRAWTHTKLEMGKLVITASKVGAPNQLPPRAKFRRQYAVQLNLFEVANNNQQEEDVIYVLLLHGKASHGQLPGFVQLAVPDAELKKYLLVIDLAAKFPNVVDEFLGDQGENDPAAAVRLRVIPKKKPGSEE